jgi:hypothetical protein
MPADAPPESNVVSLAKAREERSPHLSGEARCLQCGHEWAAVSPVGTTVLECPSCRLPKGVFRGLVTPNSPTIWICHCKCDTFWLTPQGAFCQLCGDVQNWP